MLFVFNPFLHFDCGQWDIFSLWSWCLYIYSFLLQRGQAALCPERGRCFLLSILSYILFAVNETYFSLWSWYFYINSPLLQRGHSALCPEGAWSMVIWPMYYLLSYFFDPGQWSILFSMIIVFVDIFLFYCKVDRLPSAQRGQIRGMVNVLFAFKAFLRCDPGQYNFCSLMISVFMHKSPMVRFGPSLISSFFLLFMKPFLCFHHGQSAWHVFFTLFLIFWSW